jgi:hypothetical protein
MGIIYFIQFIRGNNYSDMGIPMYVNGDNAYLTGLFLYCMAAGLLTGIIKVKIEKQGNFLFIISLFICIVYFFIFQLITAWVAGSTIYIPLF